MSMAVPPPGEPTPRPTLRPLRGGLAEPSTPFSLPAAAPATPAGEMPEVVRTDIQAADRRYEDLQRADRELHFRFDSDQRIVVDVCDLDGNVLRTIPPELALDIVDGTEAA